MPDDRESRAAMRSFLQRAEVRLSTVHRVAQALLGGSALILLLPLFVRDAFPKMTTLLVAAFDGDQHPLVIAGTATAVTVSIALPVVAIYLLVGDLLGFYFTSNTFGAAGAGAHAPRRTVFHPRFVVPGLGLDDDELSPAMRELVDEGRDDEWTRALLVPPNLDDHGWRARFDARCRSLWGVSAPPGREGDDDRLRQMFRLAGLHRDRTLAHDVARSEALLARHVLSIRIAVLRYSKALLLLIATTVATLAASGIVDEAIRQDPGAGRFVAGFPYRYHLLVALVYTLWAPAAARSVTAPLRMIQRHTPGVGEHGDVYLDQQLTQFESTAVLSTGVVLVAATTTMVVAGHQLGGAAFAFTIVAAAGGVGLWVAALRGYRAGIGQTVSALVLTLRGREAPRV